MPESPHQGFITNPKWWGKEKPHAMIPPFLVTVPNVTARLPGHADMYSYKNNWGFEACAKLTRSFGTCWDTSSYQDWLQTILVNFTEYLDPGRKWCPKELSLGSPCLTGKQVCCLCRETAYSIQLYNTKPSLWAFLIKGETRQLCQCLKLRIQQAQTEFSFCSLVKDGTAQCHERSRKLRVRIPPSLKEGTKPLENSKTIRGALSVLAASKIAWWAARQLFWIIFWNSVWSMGRLRSWVSLNSWSRTCLLEVCILT